MIDKGMRGYIPFLSKVLHKAGIIYVNNNYFLGYVLVLEDDIIVLSIGAIYNEL